MSIGENSFNLLNNRETEIFRLLCSKFLAFGNGDDDDIPKLPEECLSLEFFGNVSISLILINELLIL